MGLATSDGLVSEVEGGAASGAVVVDVEDGDACVTHGVDGPLTRSRVSVNIANVALLHLLKFESSIPQSSLHRDIAQVMVVKLVLARLHKLGHSIADHKYSWLLLLLHC